MNRGVLGVLIGIPTLAAVSVGGTYASTGKTWESLVLTTSTSWEKYADGDTWTYNAQGVPEGWKEFFECCCKTGTSGCTNSGADSSGNCTTDTKIWKVKQDKKEAIKNKCSKVGSRVDWVWNRNTENPEYTNYSQVCFKQKGSSSEE